MPNFSIRFNFETEIGVVRFQWGIPLCDTDPNSEETCRTPTTDSAIDELKEALKRDGDTWKRLQSGGEAKDELFFERWLNSKKGDVHETVKALSSHSLWRNAFVPRGAIREVRPVTSHQSQFH